MPATPNFPRLRLPMLAEVELPDVARIAVEHPHAEPVGDLEAAVVDALDGSRRLGALAPGASVAVAVGSRGVAHIATIAATTVAWLRSRGLEPFIVPAMGSHGAATVTGQTAVLARLGVTEEQVGAPIRATMDVVELGRTPAGIPCCFDAKAAAADAVVVLARVKSHTSFDRPIESGLTKMVAVGLGKAEGARAVHVLGPRGLTDHLPRLAAMAIEAGPVAFGVAVVEDAHKRIVEVEGVEPEAFAAADERLLVRARSLLARLPFDALDVLVVEWVGKELSGAGMDHAVTGRTDICGIDNPPAPFVASLGALAVTAGSRGNGMGVGVADYVTHAAAEACDLEQMYMNAVTATITEKARIAIVLADDLEVFRGCLASCWAADTRGARLAVIRSTLHLEEVLVSEALLGEVAAREDLEQRDAPAALRFATDGTLLTRAYAADTP